MQINIIRKIVARLFLSLFALLMPQLSQAAPNSAPLTAYDFMKPSSYADIALSPSGRYVAFTSIATDKFCLNRNGQMIKQAEAKCKDKKKSYRSKHQVAVYDLDKDKLVQHFQVPENFYVSWLEWASDERLLAAIYRPPTVGNKAYTIGGSRIVSIPLKGGEAAALFADQKSLVRRNRYLSRITNMLRDDPEHIIMPANKGGDLDLWKVNVLTGHANRIALGKSGTFYWYTDHAGKPVLRFDCVGRRCRKINVFSPREEAIDKAELEKKDWEKIKTFRVKPDEDEDDYDFWPIAPATETGQFYVLSNEEEDARRSIKIFDIKAQKYIKTVYEHPDVDVRGAVLNLQTGDYAGAWFYEDRLNYKFVDPTLQKHYKALNAYFKDRENVDLLGFNASGGKAVIYVSSPNNPGEYHVYDVNEQKITRLFSRRDDMEERLPAKTDILTIQMRDGKSITAYHTYLAGKRNAKTPLLVMPHGGPEVRDYYDYDPTVQYFANRGYQILQMNFRGSSGFGREFAEAGYGEWGGLMQNDVIDATKHLYDKNLASADNTCMVGYSYGGYVALYAGATEPDLYKCLVSGGGLSDLPDEVRRTKRDYGADSESYEYAVKSIGDLKADKEALKAKSPRYMAENFKTPVLLIHGEYDGISDITHSRKMRRALQKAGKDVEYLELEDEGHYGWSLENEVLYLETVEAFLSKHLTK